MDIHIHTYTHTCTYIYVYVHIYTCIYVHIYIYIYTYMHTYLHSTPRMSSSISDASPPHLSVVVELPLHVLGAQRRRVVQQRDGRNPLLHTLLITPNDRLCLLRRHGSLRALDGRVVVVQRMQRGGDGRGHPGRRGASLELVRLYGWKDHTVSRISYLIQGMLYNVSRAYG